MSIDVFGSVWPLKMKWPLEFRSAEVISGGPINFSIKFWTIGGLLKPLKIEYSPTAQQCPAEEHVTAWSTPIAVEGAVDHELPSQWAVPPEPTVQQSELELQVTSSS